MDTNHDITDIKEKRVWAFLIDWGLICFAAGIAKALSIPDLQTPFGVWGGLGLPGMFLTVVYFGLMEGSSRGATIGKEVLKLKVVDLSGQSLTYSKSFLRAFGRLVPFGWLLILFSDDGRVLHDYIGRTKVVKAE